MTDFLMTVVDNDTKEIVGDVVTEEHPYGLNIDVQIERKGANNSFEAENIDELLEKAEECNVSIYYMIGGARIPVNHTTHHKSHYLYRVGWHNLTPAEALIFGELYDSFKSGHWVSIEQLEKVLTTFDFKSTSLKSLLTKIRQKIAEIDFYLQNQRKRGYRLIHITYSHFDELRMKERQINNDLSIIYKDKKLKHVLENRKDPIEVEIIKDVTGSQILHGWLGLTRTEAEIYFELVKCRGKWVSINQLILLPWATRHTKKSDFVKKYLQNIMGRIRKKVSNGNEVILTEYRKGYCLI